MQFEKLPNIIHKEAIKLAKTNNEADISHFDMLLKDIIALSLSLRHQDSDNLRIAGNKMLRNLLWILDERSDLHDIISELHHESGGNVSQDNEVIKNTFAHIEFLSLCNKAK